MAATSFVELLERSKEPVGISLFLLMAWISTCDGDVDEEEREFMKRLAGEGELRAHLPFLLTLATSQNEDALQLSVEILQTFVKPENHDGIMQMFIGLALADGSLRTTESHVLRLIADAMSITPTRLSLLFEQMTKKAFPTPGDPSRADWWRATDGARPAGTSGRPHREAQANSEPNLQRLRALAMLGLDETASSSDVRTAYLRLAQIHHPDRFTSQGEAAVRAATESFRRINTAYESLTTNA